MQAHTVNQYFDRASLKLYEVVKSTGELKNTFKLMYDGKPFIVLSRSEKLKAGLEIGNLFMNILGLEFPTFFDNAESVSIYQKPKGQLLEATKVKGQKLTVEVM
jgi:DNA repair protein SbcC/Rad50